MLTQAANTRRAFLVVHSSLRPPTVIPPFTCLSLATCMSESALGASSQRELSKLFDSSGRAHRPSPSRRSKWHLSTKLAMSIFRCTDVCIRMLRRALLVDQRAQTHTWRKNSRPGVSYFLMGTSAEIRIDQCNGFTCTRWDALRTFTFDAGRMVWRWKEHSTPHNISCRY